MDEAELKQLGSTFKKLGVKPKSNTPEDLFEWMTQYVKANTEESNLVGEAHPTVVTASITQPPRLSYFSGEGAKGEATFDLWKYEVDCLVKEGGHTTETILQGIRRSLKGEAARIAMRLGANAKLETLLEKMKSVYGTVEIQETLMAEFYSARQAEDEDVSHWACRIEDLLTKAKQNLGPQDVNAKLHNVFWIGLKQRLKDVSGHKFDTIQDYDKLVVAIRSIEKDQNRPNPAPRNSATVKTASAITPTATDDLKEDLKSMKAMISQLTTEVASLKCKSQTQEPLQPAQEGYAQGHGRGQQGQGQGYGYNNRGRSRGRGYNRDIVCWNCNDRGHTQYECTVRTDHMRRGNANLNY